MCAFFGKMLNNNMAVAQMIYLAFWLMEITKYVALTAETDNKYAYEIFVNVNSHLGCEASLRKADKFNKIRICRGKNNLNK